MATSKIVVLLVLVAICIAAVQVRAWMERRKSKETSRPMRKEESNKSDVRAWTTHDLNEKANSARIRFGTPAGSRSTHDA
jgi:hypothetical protein